MRISGRKRLTSLLGWLLVTTTRAERLRRPSPEAARPPTKSLGWLLTTTT